MKQELMPIHALSPGANLGSYIQTVNSIPILTVEEEKRLAEDLYYHNQLDAARQLVLSHMRFVVYIARSYSGYGLSEGDLIQEGNVGLMKAVRRFNPEKGVRLVSFAVHWVKAEIHEFILRNWRIVKVATTKAQRKLFFNLRSAKKRLAWLNNAEAQAIAKDLGVEVKHVREMEGRLSAYDCAFDAPADEDDDTIFQAPAHYLEHGAASPEEELEAEDWTASNHRMLNEALGQLDDRSRAILHRRWLNEGKATLHELAAEYGVSAERIRQLEQNAMKKVRLSMET